MIDLQKTTSYNEFMEPKDLDSFLRTPTPNEIYHLQHVGELSKRYESIPKTTLDGKEVYEFTFDSLIKDGNISIMKESRFVEIPLHRHKVIEINYIYSGQCTQVIDGKEIVLNTGDVCLLDRNTLHSIHKTNEEDIVITIDMRKEYFTNGFLYKLSNQGIVSKFLVNAILDNTDEKHFIIFRSENDSELRLFFERMLCEYYDKEKSNEVIDAYMIIILSKLLKIFKRGHSLDFESDKPILILDILEYLEENYMSTSLGEAADQFGFHPTYFSNYIKKQTGKTFKELIISKKMTTACFYLMNSSEPIYEIASHVGYENLGFFFRKFRERYGINPKEYRDLYHDN